MTSVSKNKYIDKLDDIIKEIIKKILYLKMVTRSFVIEKVKDTVPWIHYE